jgi:hypothetical protein
MSPPQSSISLESRINSISKVKAKNFMEGIRSNGKDQSSINF